MVDRLPQSDSPKPFTLLRHVARTGVLKVCIRRGGVFASWLLLVLLVLEPAGPQAASAQIDEPVGDEPGQALVIMEDGRKFQGTLISQDDLEVVLLIATIETRFKAEDVMQVILLRSFEEHYQDLKTNIRPDDFTQRLVLCEWILKRRRLELAAAELEDLLDDHPQYDEARELLRRVNSEIELLNKQRQENPDQPAMGPGNEPLHSDPALAARLTPTNLLTNDQINLIRVYEINLKNPPRLIVRRATIDRLFELYGSNDLLPRTPEGRRAYYRREPIEIVSDLFQLQARDLYGEVRVLSEPVAMNKFRLNVHRVWLANSCATTRCHGGTQAGSFFLFNRNAASMNTVYTNFLILERTKINGENLLNYERPERSPLFHLGLPRNRSLWPHPNVDGWRPIFRDESDALFTRSIAWMQRMYQPRPDYRIDYQPPFVVYDLKRLSSGSGDDESQPLDNTEPEEPPTPADDPGRR